MMQAAGIEEFRNFHALVFEILELCFLGRSAVQIVRCRLKQAGHICFPSGMGFVALPVGFGKFSVEKRDHAIRHGIAGIGLHINAQTEMVHEILHRARAA